MGKYLYGIDLGTTYSCVAYLDENGKAIVCRNADGESTTPSVVQMLPGKPVVVGKEAKGTAVFEPEYTLSFIKNVIGRKDEHGEFKKIHYGNGKQISPVDASAEILKVLAKEAGDSIGDIVKDVVITCPAYFNNEQKMATKQAGIRAGLNVLSIIDEPTAAAISYGLERGETGQRFLVYDLGGGTFDITVMEIKSNGGFQVICSEGDHDLGGGRWDAMLMEHVTNLWREQFDMSSDDQMDAETLTDLKEKIEIAKKNLSERDQYNFSLATEEGTLKVSLTRELFDALTSSLLDISIHLTKKAIAQAQGFSKYKDKNGMIREKDITQILADFPDHYDASKLTKILLVGGSTYMPQVKDKIEKEFGLPTVRYEPNEAVAKGAAIYAKIVASQPTLELGIDENAGAASQLSANAQQLVLELGAESLVTTITNKSYGTDVRAKYPGVGMTMCVQNLIIRGMELPCTQADTFYTSIDNQRRVSMKIYESDYYEPLYLDDPKKLIFDRTLNIPDGYPAGTEIRVIMSLNTEGILKLDASVGGHRLNEDFEVRFE